MAGLLAYPLRNLVGGIVYMMLVMAVAVVAYVAAGWSLGDAVYMVVLTVYTVGYEEVRAIDTPLLRGITISLIVLGCTGMIFLTGALVQLIAANQLQEILGLRRMQSQIDRLRDHVIVCGFGRIGEQLARELHAGRTRFVILDRREERLAQARQAGYLCLFGDATDEAVLREAGIERARCLATVLPDDAANVFITLSARSLNRSMTIIARGEMPRTESKLLQAGADRVVLPTHIGAERIAEIILYPAAAWLVEGFDHDEDFARNLRALGLDMEVVVVEPGSRCVGRTLQEVRRETGGAFLIVALNRRDGEHLTRPANDVAIEAGDGVVLVGRAGRGEVMAELFQQQPVSGRPG